MDKLTNVIDQSGIMPGATPDPERALGALITSLLGLLGMVFFILILYGGDLWMMARGNESEVEKAKKIITSSSVGLGVVLSAYLIAFIVMELILTQTATRP